MTASRIVDHDIETSSFSCRISETVFDRTRVREVKANSVNARSVGHAFRITRCPPNLMPTGRKVLRRCSSDA